MVVILIGVNLAHAHEVVVGGYTSAFVIVQTPPLETVGTIAPRLEMVYNQTLVVTTIVQVYMYRLSCIFEWYLIRTTYCSCR